MATNIRSFKEQTLRTICLFQASIALPIVISRGSALFYIYENYYYYWGDTFYYFFREFFNVLFAAGIIFIALIQRRTQLPTKTTLMLEVGKSSLATVMWLWLILDTLFGPWQNDRYYNNPKKVKMIKLVETFTAVIVLVLFFYSTLAFAYIQWKSELADGPSDDEIREYGEETFRSEEERPLLSGSR